MPKRFHIFLRFLFFLAFSEEFIISAKHQFAERLAILSARGG